MMTLRGLIGAGLVLLGITAESAFDLLGFGPTHKTGYVYARGVLLGENGQPIFAEFDDKGDVVRELREAVGPSRARRSCRPRTTDSATACTGILLKSFAVAGPGARG